MAGGTGIIQSGEGEVQKRPNHSPQLPERKRGNSLKLHQGRFRLDTGKNPLL